MWRFGLNIFCLRWGWQFPRVIVAEPCLRSCRVCAYVRVCVREWGVGGGWGNHDITWTLWWTQTTLILRTSAGTVVSWKCAISEPELHRCTTGGAAITPRSPFCPRAVCKEKHDIFSPTICSKWKLSTYTTPTCTHRHLKVSPPKIQLQQILKYEKNMLQLQ